MTKPRPESPASSSRLGPHRGALGCASRDSNLVTKTDAPLNKAIAENLRAYGDRERPLLSPLEGVSEHACLGPNRESPERKPHGNLNSDDKKVTSPSATPLSVSHRPPGFSGSLLHGSEAKSFLSTLPVVHSCSWYLFHLFSACRILYYAVCLGCDLQTV